MIRSGLPWRRRTIRRTDTIVLALSIQRNIFYQLQSGRQEELRQADYIRTYIYRPAFIATEPEKN